jgi:gamma-glutamyl-gamma-aminobutyrate hydrolase PuuD
MFPNIASIDWSMSMFAFDKTYNKYPYIHICKGVVMVVIVVGITIIQSMPITSKAVNSNSAHVEVFSMEHHVSIDFILQNGVDTFSNGPVN